MSLPLLSALLPTVAALVFLTMQAERWRPTPLLASADRPKFPFGGKRKDREPEPDEQGPGLLDEVAGGRYGGGKASLPPLNTGPVADRPNATTKLPRLFPDSDHPSAPTDGTAACDPVVGHDTTVDYPPPPPPPPLGVASIPGEPNWPREMGLLEAIANMPEEHALDNAGQAALAAAPASPEQPAPPLPFGIAVSPPFADLAQVEPWETRRVAESAAFATPPAAPASEDPDSWHSWQWQTDTMADTTGDEPLPSPETMAHLFAIDPEPANINGDRDTSGLDQHGYDAETILVPPPPPPAVCRGAIASHPDRAR